MANSFAEFTPEYWIREIRPLLIRMRERSMDKARERALTDIRNNQITAAGTAQRGGAA
jgi:hypothetical protein